MNDTLRTNLRQLIFVSVLLAALLVGVFFLLKYFYPNQDFKPSLLVNEPSVTSQPDDEVVLPITSDTTISARTNLTRDIIFNASYGILAGEPEHFKLGKFKRGTFDPRSSDFADAQIAFYGFGDLTSDGSGDAVVVTATNVGEAVASELFVVVNVAGEPKPVYVIPPFAENIVAAKYTGLSVSSGKITLSMDLMTSEGVVTSKTETYTFDGRGILPVTERLSWKKYISTEFGFKLEYPESSTLTVRPIIQNSKELFGTLYLNFEQPFITRYEGWTKKSFTLYVNQGACPYRNASAIIERNGIEFHVYDPEPTHTSTVQKNMKLREYMTYNESRCYTILMTLEGPGPKAGLSPQELASSTPDNLSNFIKLELVSLEQVLDTLGFLNRE